MDHCYNRSINHHVIYNNEQCIFFVFLWFSVRKFCLIYDPGDRSSVPGRVIHKTQKMVLDASLLNTQHYKVRIRGKWSHPEKEVALSAIHRCYSYRKERLQVALDNGLPTHLHIYIYIYIYIYIRFNK